MEGESTNGKLTRKEELQGEEKEVVIEGVEELKPDYVDDSLRENFVDEKETLKEVDDRSVEVVNLEKLEGENEGFDSVVKSAEPLVPMSEELIPGVSDVAELESKEIKEQIQPSLDEMNELSAAVTNVVLEEAAETIMSAPYGNVGDSSDIDKLASKENADNLLQMPADVPSADTDKMERNVEVEISDGVINQPAVSLAPRARQMTSWRNCCGLFDFLRRSNR